MKVKEGVFKYLDVNTGHITRLDDTTLAEDDGTANIGITADPHPYGYWVWVPTQLPGLVGDLRDAKNAGFSASIRRLVAKARRLGCSWIKLDSDGNMYDDLPQYDW